MTIKNALVVTRHQSLVDYLREQNVIDDSATIIAHATASAVTGKNVIGVLPHSLSCLTASFTEVPLDLPSDLRGKELSVEQMRQYAKSPITYSVTCV